MKEGKDLIRIEPDWNVKEAAVDVEKVRAGLE